VGSEGWPGRFGGESGDVLVGLVELCDALGSDKLFGRDVEAVGVALNRLEKPGRWIIELPQQSVGGDWRFIAGEDLLQQPRSAWAVRWCRVGSGCGGRRRRRLGGRGGWRAGRE
jgi:hypothetical protein